MTRTLEQIGSKIVVIGGPTASGKTALSLSIAKDFDGEVINCDSVQAYRGFDIGAAKPSLEERQGVAHHLFDIWDADKVGNANDFAIIAKQKIFEVMEGKKLPILVGGSGLYLRAILGENFDPLPSDQKLKDSLQKLSIDDLRSELQALDPIRASELHPNDKFRHVRAVELCRLLGEPISEHYDSKSSGVAESFETAKILLHPERKELHQRIEARVLQMLEQGFIEEVKRLLDSGVSRNHMAMQSIGYKEVSDYLNQVDLGKELSEAITIKTRQYAKRQVTWFKKMQPNLVLAHPNDYRKEQLEALIHQYPNPQD